MAAVAYRREPRVRRPTRRPIRLSSRAVSRAPSTGRVRCTRSISARSIIPETKASTTSHSWERPDETR